MDGTKIVDREEILIRVHEFYSDLYKDISGTHSLLILDDGLECTNDDKFPEITQDEVEFSLRNFKNGKSPGEDGIQSELLKLGGEEIHKVLAKLYNECLKQRKIPATWNNATMILIFKKGDKNDIKNYRPISLLSAMYKLFTRIITARIEKQLDFHQPREQAGFRRGFSTMDHI